MMQVSERLLLRDHVDVIPSCVGHEVGDILA